jgi:diacylglycerol kinase
MSLFRTLNNAFKGLWHFLTSESNNRVHVAAILMVIAAGFYFRIALYEWLVLIVVMGMVLSSEAFNAAIEYLCNEVQPEYNERIRIIKDISAGSVLISAIVALAAGLIIFLPKILDWFF